MVGAENSRIMKRAFRGPGAGALAGSGGPGACAVGGRHVAVPLALLSPLETVTITAPLSPTEPETLKEAEPA